MKKKELAKKLSGKERGGETCHICKKEKVPMKSTVPFCIKCERSLRTGK